MSLFDDLTTGAPATSTSTSSSSLPAWYQDYLNDTLSAQAQVSNAPYQPYTGPRVAPLTADQNAAATQIQGNQGAWQPDVSAGSTAASGVASGALNSSNALAFTSPFTQDAASYIANNANAAFTAPGGTLDQINSQFTGNGQFGSTRSMAAANQGANTLEQNVLGQQASLQNSAYGTALSGYTGALNATNTAASTLGNLGTATQNLGQADASALDAVGQEQQNNTQSNYDTAYSDFLAQRGYPQQETSAMLSALEGTTPPSTTTSSTSATPAGVSPLGALSSAAALAKAFNVRTGGRISHARANRARFADGGLAQGPLSTDGSGIMSNSMSPQLAKAMASTIARRQAQQRAALATQLAPLSANVAQAAQTGAQLNTAAQQNAGQSAFARRRLMAQQQQNGQTQQQLQATTAPLTAASGLATLDAQGQPVLPTAPTGFARGGAVFHPMAPPTVRMGQVVTPGARMPKMASPLRALEMMRPKSRGYSLPQPSPLTLCDGGRTWR